MGTSVCAALFFSGCSCTGGTLCPNSYPKEPESMNILKMQSLDQNKTKVYVDNSLDRAKNRLFIEAFNEAINTHTSWDDVSVSEAAYNKKDTEFLSKQQPKFNEKIEQSLYESYIAKVTMDHYAMSGNHMYRKNMPYNSDGKARTSVKYPAHNYTSVVLDDTHLEIKGFENEKEAVDLFLYLVDATIKFGTDEKFTETIEKTFQTKGTSLLDPTKYYAGMALEFDPIALDKEGRLIIKSVLDYYSMKIALEKELSTKMQIVNDAKDADMIIAVNNLTYTSLITTSKENIEKIQTQDMTQMIDTHIKSTSNNSVNQAGMSLHTLSTNTAGSAQARGATGAIAGAELALSVLSILTEPKAPNKTQNRFDLQKVYFLKPTGEVITQKIYLESTTFNADFMQTYYFQLAAFSNTKIAKQILFDLQ